MERQCQRDNDIGVLSKVSTTLSLVVSTTKHIVEDPATATIKLVKSSKLFPLFFSSNSSLIELYTFNDLAAYEALLSIL